VTHFSRLSIVVFDVPAADNDKEVAFWQAAAGAELTHYTRYPEYHGGAVTETLGLLVQRLGDGPARVHVDIHTDDLDAEVARLAALGAERVSQEGHWCVMRDPAGLPFCVVPEPAASFDRTGARQWD
jgi:predicted enzyme related to lactoylglutathione lyase